MKQTSDNFQKILKWSVDRTVIFSRQNMFPKTDQITIWQVGPAIVAYTQSTSANTYVT